MNGGPIAVGSRGSPLALAQARLVAEALDRAGHPSRIVVVETEGDRRAPDTAWGEGAFVAAIERALIAGRVDIAVHSAKDVPTDEDPRLLIGAYLPRADARDALVVRVDARERRLDDLPMGSRVGTDSPRRTGFLLARRPDLTVHPLHGNVDTRLRRLDAGETDALVLACAGLDRMGLAHRIVERLAPEVVPPAPGQGAIAVQIRREDARLVDLVASIDHRRTRLAVEAERAFLVASGGGCRAPIGALATITSGAIELLGGYASPDGTDTAVGRRHGPLTASRDLARELATELGSSGRASPGSRVTREAPGPRAPRVLVTRAADQASELMSELRSVGLDPIGVPTIAVEIEPAGGELDAAVRRLDVDSWVVITSANGARAVLRVAGRVGIRPRLPRWAAIGPATRRLLEGAGVLIAFQPSRSSAMALAAELPLNPGDRVLLVHGDLADEGVAAALRARGAEVDEVLAYRTREAPNSSRALLRRAMEGPIAAVAFTSGSTVRGLVALGRAESVDVASIPSVCIGPETAEEASTAGFRVLAVAPVPASAALAAAAARALAHQPQETP